MTKTVRCLLLLLPCTLLVDGGGLSSSLQVVIPNDLRRTDGYDHREAMFGNPPYGGVIDQTVYYAGSDLCDQNEDYSRGGYPEREVDWHGKMLPWEPPFILMVDRGECSFVQKVRNAQQSGAAAVIIADNVCLCSEEDSCTSDEPCEEKEPIMADNGSGGDVTIPSILMFKKHADLIKDVLRNNKPVRVAMSWSLPASDDDVDYDFWFNPSDNSFSGKFLTGWKPIAEALGERAYFTPFPHVSDGWASGCQFGGEHCSTYCTNNGRYCSFSRYSAISGATVVKESLRQLCIWRKYGQDGVGERWWNYIQEFTNRCNNEDYFASDDCIKDCLKRADIDESGINQCMADSGGTDGDGPNEVLEEQLHAQQERGVFSFPSLQVNGRQLSTDAAFQTICSAYKVGAAPYVCNACVNCRDAIECVSTGVCWSTVPPGYLSSSTLVVSMFFLLGLFGIGTLWHYRKTKEDMRAQVRSALADYMPLEGNDHDTPFLHS